MGPKINDVETRPWGEFEGDVEWLRDHQSGSVSGGDAVMTPVE
jgi:hypothetical protein